MTGEGNEVVDHIRAVKGEIAEALFGTWRVPDNTSPSTVSELSFWPKSPTKPDGDVLTKDGSRNQDIFTCQRWAAKRAHDAFRRMIEHRTLFEKLDDLRPTRTTNRNQGSARETFEIKIVGSSVSGLTFTAVLVYLIDAWEELYPKEVKLSDLIHIELIDNHIRPLQRLLQARDRRIIPRFEYERLLEPENGELAIPQLLKRSDPQDRDMLSAFWNETDNLDSSDNIKANCAELKVDYVPEHLQWEAGTVRHVAKQLLKGYEALVEDHRMVERGPREGVSTTGGRIFRSAQLIDPQADEDDAIDQGPRLMINFAGETTPISGDYVLLAKGPGVDISGYEGPVFSLNSQDSFWNAPKIELDLVEAETNQVLVLGNGDSTAGGIFSTLLKDPEACSYRFLTDLLRGSSHAQVMFRRLRAAVGPTPSDKTVTSHWQFRLRDKDVLSVLYGEADEERRQITGAVKTRLRSFVNVAVSLRAKLPKPKERQKNPSDQGCVKPHWVSEEPELPVLGPGAATDEMDAVRDLRDGWLKQIPPFIDFRDVQDTGSERGQYRLPTSGYLKARLFSNCWPENRIALALMSPQMDFYQDNLASHPDSISRKSTAERRNANYDPNLPETNDNQPFNTFHYRVPLFEVPITQLSFENSRPKKVPFKYILDGRGGKFFALRGNLCRWGHLEDVG